jgi:hypothetical protein
MTRPSSIDTLEPRIQSEIGRLRMQGCTIDQIVAHLASMHGVTTVSRSAMGRHVKGLERVAEQIRRSREVATALVQQLGDAPESETARLNIEIMHSAILDLKMRSADGEEVDKGGAAALAGNPEGIMLLSKAIDHLSKAQKSNLDFLAQVEKRAAEMAAGMRGQVLTEAADKAATVATEAGLSADRAAQIRRDVLGLRPKPV